MIKSNRLATLIKAGNWSDVFLMHDDEYGDVARKYLHYASLEQTMREHKCSLDAYVNGLPVPKPLNIGYCKIAKKYYIDSIFLPFVALRDNDIVTLLGDIITLAEQLKSINCVGCEKNWWNIYHDDLKKALMCCVNGLPFSGGEKRMLIMCYDWLINLKPVNFIHGDFALQNMGLYRGKIYIYDFQWGCAGPKDWDISYLLCQYTPALTEVLYLVNKKVLFTTLTCAAIKLGRGILAKNNIEVRLSLLHAWIDMAKTYL